MPKTAALLVNLGSPEQLTVGSVRRYLREFLSDPRVLDINAVGRFLLLNLFILPFRPKRSLAAYQQVWTAEGSPLITLSQSFANKISKVLAKQQVDVHLAMRYGQPALDKKTKDLIAQGYERIILVPLYPQYASSSTGTVVQHFLQTVAQAWNTPSISIVDPFYDHPKFITAQATVIAEHLPTDHHLLFSFHGLPQRHIAKSENRESPICLEEKPCPNVKNNDQPYCYRSQCYQTAYLLTQQLEQSDYSVAFQSRLGRTPWIKPYTDHLLPDLRKRGISKLAVAAPAFVTDCLETLEEIAIRLRQQWIEELGGESFCFIPCMNDHDAWVDACAHIISRHV